MSKAARSVAVTVIMLLFCVKALSNKREYLCFFDKASVTLKQQCQWTIAGFMVTWITMQHWDKFDYWGRPDGPPHLSPPAFVFVAGYAEDSADDSANRQLSSDRAQNVAAQLERLGVPHDHLSIRMIGSGHPLDPANLASAVNRRVQIGVASQP